MQCSREMLVVNAPFVFALHFKVEKCVFIDRQIVSYNLKTLKIFPYENIEHAGSSLQLLHFMSDLKSDHQKNICAQKYGMHSR